MPASTERLPVPSSLGFLLSLVLHWQNRLMGKESQLKQVVAKGSGRTEFEDTVFVDQ